MAIGTIGSENMAWMNIPIHEKLNKTETKSELKKHNLDMEELPLIQLGDPAIQTLIESGIKIEINDVIKIYRDSLTGGKDTPYFRKVIY